MEVIGYCRISEAFDEVIHLKDLWELYMVSFLLKLTTEFVSKWAPSEKSKHKLNLTTWK